MRGEEREHLLVGVYAKGADAENIAPDVELAVAEQWEQEGRVYVGLGDEVAQVGRQDAFFGSIQKISVVIHILGVRVWSVGFPLFEYGAQFLFTAKETDTLPAVAHAGFQDPPLFLCFFTFHEASVSGEAFVELVGFYERFLEEFCVVEFEVGRGFDVVFQDTIGMFGKPRGDSVS